LRAYKHLGSFRGTCSFKTWITRIAINSAFMLLRKRKNRMESSFEIVGEEGDMAVQWDVPDPALSPEQIYLRNQTRQIVRNAVSGLPPFFRSIVELCHVNQISVINAAQALGISQAAAKSRLSRGRTALRHRLEKYSAI
jgi:RNA polymerase sigma-70 factor (ECF subfamily)